MGASRAAPLTPLRTPPGVGVGPYNQTKNLKIQATTASYKGPRTHGTDSRHHLYLYPRSLSTPFLYALPTTTHTTTFILHAHSFVISIGIGGRWGGGACTTSGQVQGAGWGRPVVGCSCVRQTCKTRLLQLHRLIVSPGVSSGIRHGEIPGLKRRCVQVAIGVGQDITLIILFIYRSDWHGRRLPLLHVN